MLGSQFVHVVVFRPVDPRAVGETPVGSTRFQELSGPGPGYLREFTHNGADLPLPVFAPSSGTVNIFYRC